MSKRLCRHSNAISESSKINIHNCYFYMHLSTTIIIQSSQALLPILDVYIYTASQKEIYRKSVVHLCLLEGLFWFQEIVKLQLSHLSTTHRIKLTPMEAAKSKIISNALFRKKFLFKQHTYIIWQNGWLFSLGEMYIKRQTNKRSISKYHNFLEHVCIM